MELRYIDCLFSIPEVGVGKISHIINIVQKEKKNTFISVCKNVVKILVIHLWKILP